MSKNYIFIPNQGNIYQHLMLLNEMANSVGYSDKNGYFTKQAIAEIGIKSYIITSAGKIGEDIIEKASDTETDEGLNSVLQNAKQRMQILRVLGLVSTDYGSELYAITDLGKKVLDRVFPLSHADIPDFTLLREAFMGISSSSEVYDYQVDFNSHLGYEICYALSCLDYRISTEEMTMIITYSLDEIDEFVKTVKTWRSQQITINNEHEHLPKKQDKKPVKNPKNLTRTINQILRICDIIENKQTKIGNKNYYVCTESGKKYVDDIKKFLDKKSSKIWTSQKFRKENLLKQKNIATIGYNNMLDKGGYSVEPIDKNTVFSPYQLNPETSALWLLKNEIKKPPESKKEQAQKINNHMNGKKLMLKPSYITQEEYDSFIKTHVTKNNIIWEISSEKEKGTDKQELINNLTLRYKYEDKNKFYPFVHSLFEAMGLESKGETGRIDGLLMHNNIEIPTEIKSFTETPTYNMKGIRQSLENKIILHKEPRDLSYASLLVGYSHPYSHMEEIQEFIGAVYKEIGIKIITFDLRTLVMMCVNSIWEEKKIDFDELLVKYGIVEF